MPVSKPTSLPEWASSVSADITVPSLSKQQQGWVVEQPPHDYFNWWQNLVYQWSAWLQALENQAHTWVNQIFASSVAGTPAVDATNTATAGKAIRGTATTGAGVGVEGVAANGGGAAVRGTASGGAMAFQAVGGSITGDTGLNITGGTAVLPAGAMTYPTPAVGAFVPSRPKLGYCRTAQGRTRIEGGLGSLGGGGAVTVWAAGTIPAGQCPTANVQFPCNNSGYPAIGTVGADGSLTIGSAASTGATPSIACDVYFEFNPSNPHG